MTGLAARNRIVLLVDEAVQSGARQRQACEVIGMSERTLQRWRENPEGDRRPSRVQEPSNKLDDLEQQRVLNIANSPEFGHLPPAQIVPRLLDQGEYIASQSSFYRVLRKAGQTRHRCASKPAERRKPQPLVATRPNQIYSWDITYLPTTIRGVYLFLYLFLDIYSRKIVGWQVYEEECSELAAEVIADVCAREKVLPNQVVLHSDNGGPMKGATMVATLQKLGVIPSLSRPAVSNDNPYSESLFRTMKYRSEYPHRPFDDLIHARAWVAKFVYWYNEEHRHSAIRYVTPSQRHAGLDIAILAHRHDVQTAARQRRPDRWSGPTRNWTPAGAVHLNPTKSTTTQAQCRAA